MFVHVFSHVDVSPLFPLRLGAGTVSSISLGSKGRGCASLLRLACPEVPSFLHIPSPGALPGAQHTMRALSGGEGAAWPAVSPVWIGIGSPKAGAGRLTDHKRHYLSLRLHPSVKSTRRGHGRLVPCLQGTWGWGRRPDLDPLLAFWGRGGGEGWQRPLLRSCTRVCPWLPTLFIFWNSPRSGARRDLVWVSRIR